MGRKRSILLLDPSIRERVTRPSESLQRWGYEYYSNLSQGFAWTNSGNSCASDSCWEFTGWLPETSAGNYRKCHARRVWDEFQISPENPWDSEEYTLIEAALETVWRNRYRLGPLRSPKVGVPSPRGGLMYSRANVRTNFNDPSVTIQQSRQWKGVQTWTG